MIRSPPILDVPIFCSVLGPRRLTSAEDVNQLRFWLDPINKKHYETEAWGEEEAGVSIPANPSPGSDCLPSYLQI